ncbi:unnamed protein product [marine sediment metagenome]|uniref:ArnR1-like winged helix-turn-helix domain-containing protein n=1 Tax=marine sediment metagenome TaxID=412755 RepID=X1KLG6_9ZZZZ
MSNRRNNLDISADILRTAHSGARKTRIVYQANLNFDIVKKYLKALLDRGLDEDLDNPAANLLRAALIAAVAL